jgi:hypothetical protein
MVRVQLKARSQGPLLGFFVSQKTEMRVQISQDILAAMVSSKILHRKSEEKSQGLVQEWDIEGIPP